MSHAAGSQDGGLCLFDVLHPERPSELFGRGERQSVRRSEKQKFQRELKILNTARPSANTTRRFFLNSAGIKGVCALGCQHILACNFAFLLSFLKVGFSCFACITVVWNRFGCCIFFVFPPFLPEKAVPWKVVTIGAKWQPRLRLY